MREKEKRRRLTFAFARRGRLKAKIGPAAQRRPRRGVARSGSRSEGGSGRTRSKRRGCRGCGRKASTDEGGE
eukprot:4359654-Prymnesium_polylepis.1